MINGFLLNGQLLYGFLLSLAIVVFSYYSKSLNLSGAVTTLILGTLIFGVGGWLWSVPILTFFISASALSKTGAAVKQKFKDTFEKSGTRDYGQVLANGGLGGLLVMLAVLHPQNARLYFYAYILSFAAANADTWATELGVLLKGKPILITTFKRVEPGVSGGISFYGSFAALLGSFFIVLATVLFQPMPIDTLITLGLLGFAASFIDSLLGAAVQAQYRCNLCHKYTEKKIHCGRPAKKIKGLSWMTNDLVNFISILFAVIWFLSLN